MRKTRKTIYINKGVARHPLYRLRQPVDFEILEGEQIAIIGDNGAGKSMLVDMITGKHPLLGEGVKYDFGARNDRMVSDNIRYVAFKDTYGTGDDVCYQLRWNKHEEDNTPLVADVLDEAFALAEHAETLVGNPSEEQLRLRTREREQLRERLYEAFAIDRILGQKLSLLSSGELRKFQLTRALLTNPQLVIIENPFIGLDVNARRQLNDLLQTLIKETTMQIVLIVARPEDIPQFMTHVYRVDGMVLHGKQSLEEYMMEWGGRKGEGLPEESRRKILGLPVRDEDASQDACRGEQCVIDFRNVCIRYGERAILKDLNLTVMDGERWALSGENGAGKSTLLSIVCADNLQSYANDIVLFGKPRGSGESIWDIKKHIGYVSPELHRSYSKDIPAIEVVASGLSDSVGLYKRPRPEQMGVCEFWMEVFGILPHRDTPFLQLSSGEQRLVLLARAFVKDPSLLILDEPLHGLDTRNRRLVLDVIETFCRRPNKTLIMVTHYEEELPPCVDKRIHLLRQS